MSPASSFHSLRRNRVVVAPAMNSISPQAASGVRIGAMSSAAGRMSPRQPVILMVPMTFRCRSSKSST